LILIPKRKLGDIPTQQNLTIQETLRQVKGLNLDWANIKNVVVQTADIENLAVTTAKINTLAVTDAKIESLSISKLTVGNLAVTGTLTTGGYLKSTNYVADTAGWQVDYLGNAEFNSVKVRGSIYTSSIVSGNTLTISGTISAGAGGVIIDSAALKIYGAYLWLYSGTTLVGNLNASSTTQVLLASNYDMILMSGGTARTIYLGPSGGNGVAVYNNLLYPDNSDKSVDLGSSTHRFRRAYCSPIVPIYNAETSEAEEGSMTYSWNGTILTLLVYASGSWRMHPVP